MHNVHWIAICLMFPSLFILQPLVVNSISFQDDPCSTGGTMSSSIDEKRSEPWANLLAGGVGGLACQVIGHPFDTVKVTLFRNISDVVFIDHILYCHSYRFWSKLSIFNWFSQGAPSDNEANRPFWKDGLHQCHRLLLKNSNLHVTC